MFRDILSANGFQVEELSNATFVVIIPYVDKDDYENIEEFNIDDENARKLNFRIWNLCETDYNKVTFF